MVGSYKSAVTKQINELYLGIKFHWQRYFHDHIIRTERALQNIADYIRLNPARWNEDLENENFRTGLTMKERKKLSKEFYSKLLTI